MNLPDGVFAFPIEYETDDGPATIYPSAVETPKGLVLLDVGYAAEVDQLERRLDEAGFGWDDVGSVVLTHQDGDHAGALEAVVDRTDATVYAHERAVPYIDGRLFPIKSGAERYPPVPVDVEVVDGVSFRTDAGPMRVVFTPGHAPGHVVLHFPAERLLIAADALTVDDDGALDGPGEAFTPDMIEAVESVGRLRDLDVDRTLTYHGGLVQDGTERLEAIYDEMRGG